MDVYRATQSAQESTRACERERARRGEREGGWGGRSVSGACVSVYNLQLAQRAYGNNHVEHTTLLLLYYYFTTTLLTACSARLRR